MDSSASECSDSSAWIDFEDMVLDEDRNRKYRDGVKGAIALTQLDHRPAQVLDIGSGSGLLSFYAAKADADTVLALEMDPVVYNTSMEIAKRNGLDHRILFVNSISTEYKTMSRCNILVSEMVDSELIGENLIPTYRHALQNLVTADMVAVPARASVFVVPVQSEFVRKHSVLPQRLRRDCEHDLRGVDGQWSRLGKEDVQLAGPRVLVKTFDLASLDSLVCQEALELELTLDDEDVHQVDGLLFFWELDMNGDGRLIISSEPWKSPWRNHWLPMFFGFVQPVIAHAGKTVHVTAFHDEVSFWFRPRFDQRPSPVARTPCSCEWHSVVPARTVFRWNQCEESELAELFSKLCFEKTVLSVGDESCLPLRLADSAKRVLALETDPWVAGKLKRLMCVHNGQPVQLANSLEELPLEQVELVVFDLFAPSLDSPLCWAAVIKSVKERCPDVRFVPNVIQLKMTAVRLGPLAKRRARFDRVDEFDYSDFARLCLRPRCIESSQLERLPLWEYETEWLVTWTVFSFFEPLEAAEEFSADLPPDADALVFWVHGEHHGEVLAPALLDTPAGAEWSKWSVQLVHFLPDKHSDRARLNFDLDRLSFQLSV